MELLRRIRREELFRHISLVFVASIIAGFLNYLYHIYMGRALGPLDYGTFGSLVSIFYMATVLSTTIETTVTRYVSKLIGEGVNPGPFLRVFLSKVLILSVVSFVVFTAASGLIAGFLGIAVGPVLVLAIALFFSWLVPFATGVLRGRKMFKEFGALEIIRALFKLLASVALVALGFGVNGAIGGLVVAGGMSLILAMLIIRPHFSISDSPVQEYSKVMAYSWPVGLALICLSVPGNLDVVLAKHFFPAVEAGMYTSASVLGKVILFIPGAVYIVMFPMVSEAHAKNEHTKQILLRALLYTSLLSGSVALVYLFIPGVTVLLFGPVYSPALPLVGPYGIAMFFFSLTWVIVFYNLAVHNLRYISLLASLTALETALLLLFHATALEMILVLVGVNAALLLVSLLYTLMSISGEA